MFNVLLFETKNLFAIFNLAKPRWPLGYSSVANQLWRRAPIPEPSRSQVWIQHRTAASWLQVEAWARMAVMSRETERERERERERVADKTKGGVVC
jgi:hypothetical protein